MKIKTKIKAGHCIGNGCINDGDPNHTLTLRTAVNDAEAKPHCS